jgi:hypothetical protein
MVRREVTSVNALTGLGIFTAMKNELSAELNDAEEKLLDAVRKGKLADFGDHVPATAEERRERTIRVEVLRLLMLGDYKGIPAYERGVRIRGAVIDGTLDFQGCKLTGDLALVFCELKYVKLYQCRTRTITLDGSRCDKVLIANAEIDGSIQLRNGFTTKRVVRIVGSKIAGSLDCAKGKFLAAERSLICEYCEIQGKIVLRAGFEASGLVRLNGVSVRDNVECTGGKFGSNDTWIAPTSTDLVEAYRHCLIIRDVTIRGTLVLEKDREAGPYGTFFRGGVDLSGTRMARLVDDVTEQAKRRNHVSASIIEGCPAFFRLAGFSIRGFSGETDISGNARIAFLKLQCAKDLGNGFKPQPWVQTVKVLRDTGHIEAARQVAIEYEKIRRQAKAFGGKPARAAHWLYGLLVGYGHRPGRLVWTIIVVWLLLGEVYYLAAIRGVFVPTNPVVLRDAKYAQCRIGDQNEKIESSGSGNWYRCHSLSEEYTAFNPYLYSLDLILPLVDLQQKKNWVPVILTPRPYEESKRWFDDLRLRLFSTRVLSHIVHVLMWLEILFGWGASFLLAAVLSGLAKRMD